MSPRVSVVIPCWNAAAYLSQAISSALSQSHSNCEVIVVDDGSTDESLDVIRSFGDRVRWTSGPNRGGCAARNAGLRMSTGTLVQFLDADDWLHPNKVERQVAAMADCGDAITYTDHFVRLVGDGAVDRLRACATLEEDPVLFVLRHRTLCITGPLHRRDQLVAIGGFREGLRASQEFDLHLRLAMAGASFCRIPEPLFTIRRRPDSVSSHTGATLACLLDILPEAVDGLMAAGKLDALRRAEFAGYAARSARLCMRNDRWEAGLALLRFAESVDAVAADREAYGPAARLLKPFLGPRLIEWMSMSHQVSRRWLAALRSVAHSKG